MKIWRLLKRFEIKFHFSIGKVKRIEFSIPDEADDCHLRHGLHDGGRNQDSWSSTSDGEDKILYWSSKQRKLEGSPDNRNEPYEISIPKCKRSVEVSCTPMHDIEKRKAGITPYYSSNRKIVIDCYY